jgi:hypothetical protein
MSFYFDLLGLDNTDFENDLLIGDSPDFGNNARSLDDFLFFSYTRLVTSHLALFGADGGMESFFSNALPFTRF